MNSSQNQPAVRTANVVCHPSYAPPAQTSLSISVIICTYGRSAALGDLLEALRLQTYPHLEILLIDGNGDTSPARDVVQRYLAGGNVPVKPIVIPSEKGLTRQRNVGLGAAKGDIICFFDDDVTIEPDFLQKVAELFEKLGMQDVGGITPYDTLHYPTPLNLRWRLRAYFGVMPGLDPGKVDHLGRAVPLSFLKPWSGHKEIGWLPGFCMIYRRAAVEGLYFDEMLPTYGGEDRDFSMEVGKRHRLLICGDLHLKHHYTVEGRDNGLPRLRESSFGVGRRFGKVSWTVRDWPTVASTLLGDFLVDIIALIRSPNRISLITPFVRMRAFCEGIKSAKTAKVCGARKSKGVLA